MIRHTLQRFDCAACKASTGIIAPSGTTVGQAVQVMREHGQLRCPKCGSTSLEIAGPSESVIGDGIDSARMVPL